MAVTTLEIKARTPFAEGQQFGDTGSYELWDGMLHFALDPGHPRNGAITDILLAPRDARGLVHFSSDFTMLRPKDPQRGNHRILLDVLNRGNKLALGMFNRAPRAANPRGPVVPGDGFLMRQGYTVVWCGWQHDVPAGSGLMSIDIPDAVTPNGPVSGKILVTIQPNAPGQVQCLVDRLMQNSGTDRCYRTNNVHDQAATLIVRDHEDATPHVVPRDQWSFAKVENGRVIPDALNVYLASGFVPGKVYQVVYSTTGAPVAGLGFLATLDAVAFLRYAAVQEGNPCAGDVQFAYAFGASQSGRFLRQLLYLGLNEDEIGRQVFEGVFAHIAGARHGEFNQRFAQPSPVNKESMGNLFPFTDLEQTGPETGRTDGLLARLIAKGRVPKTFYTNTSAEYWRGDAALIHVDGEGMRDFGTLDRVRIYHFAGTQHGSGALPLTDVSPADPSTRGQHPFNTVDYTPLLRAALVNLDRWVTSDQSPPPSKHPRLQDGTALAPAGVATAFKAIPGVRFPGRFPSLSRLDFGPRAPEGIAETLPATQGKSYPTLVSSVDRDGNEVAGIRLPDISVPLATYAGWNLRHPSMGAPDQLLAMMGSTLTFPRNKAAPGAPGDPRLSIEERYSSKEDYRAKVLRAARTLADEGYVLAQDVDLLVQQASERYDAFCAAAQPNLQGRKAVRTS